MFYTSNSKYLVTSKIFIYLLLHDVLIFIIRAMHILISIIILRNYFFHFILIWRVNFLIYIASLSICKYWEKPSHSKLFSKYFFQFLSIIHFLPSNFFICFNQSLILLYKFHKVYKHPQTFIQGKSCKN